MKLTTLGCWGAYPYKDGGTTSYLVTSEDGFQLLMDCGSRAVTELEKEMDELTQEVGKLGRKFDTVRGGHKEYA